MSARDAWARLTPYELGIPGRDFAEGAFAAIREEAAGRGVDPADPGAFLQLGEVGRVLREIQGGERGGASIERFAAFVFHAYHFHRGGERLFLMGTDRARALVDPPYEGASWSGDLPSEAGYLQLPHQLFWSHPDPQGAAEPIDGVFWVRGAGDTISLLVALGLRGNRPGLSVMELPPLPLAEATHWVTGGTREEGADFETTLPGGDLDRLYSVVTLGEVLTLIGRAFAHLAQAPESLGSEERAPRADVHGSEATGPRPTLLPFRRIG